MLTAVVGAQLVKSLDEPHSAPGDRNPEHASEDDLLSVSAAAQVLALVPAGAGAGAVLRRWRLDRAKLDAFGVVGYL